MPFTPLHLGPGVALKSIIRSRMSLFFFVLVQILIDLETFFYMMQGAWPIHRFAHTLPGSTAVAFLALLAGLPIYRWVRGLSLGTGRFQEARDFLCKENTTLTSAISGVLIGAWSHVLLDSVMHSDVKPLAPFMEGNGLLYAISIDHLHLLCIVSGMAGMLLLFWFKRRPKRINEP